MQNIQIDSDINQYTNAYDTIPQYTIGYDNLKAQYIKGVSNYNTNIMIL